MITKRYFVPLFITLFVGLHIAVAGLKTITLQAKTTHGDTALAATSPFNQRQYKTPAHKSAYPETTKELIKLLGDKAEWFNYKNSPIIERLPKDFSSLPLDKRKRVFIAAILPIAVAVKKQFDREHRYVIEMRNKIDQTGFIDQQNREKLNKLFARYRIKNGSLPEKINKLLIRTGSVPISLILAQAAIESNWGASRFAIEGNNLFGIRTYKGKGIEPADYSGKKRFRVVVYKNLEASIKSYIINFNTGWAYKRLRKIRNAIYPNENPYMLANSLIYYSTRRGDYIKAVKDVIVRNNFERFDKNNST